MLLPSLDPTSSEEGETGLREVGIKMKGTKV